MSIEAQLRERLRKAEALHAGAATAGERNAAGAAIERLRARLAETSRADPPVEIKFTFPDSWAVRLFTALCRRYGFEPYRYSGQRRTTLMVKAPTCLRHDRVEPVPGAARRSDAISRGTRPIASFARRFMATSPRLASRRNPRRSPDEVVRRDFGQVEVRDRPGAAT